MDLITALPQLLGMGATGLLAFAVVTVVRGDWVPKINHEKLMEHQKAGYEAVIAQYKVIDEEKSKEILRLRTRNDEVVQASMNQTAATTNMIEALRLALAKGGHLPSSEGDGRGGAMRLSQLVTDFIESLFAPLFPPLPDPSLPEPEPIPPTPKHQTDRALRSVLKDIKIVQAEQIEQMLALYGEVASDDPGTETEEWL